MHGYLNEFTLDLGALIEPSTVDGELDFSDPYRGLPGSDFFTDGEGLTEPYGDLPRPDFLIAATTNPDDKQECSPKSSMEFPLSSETICECLASIAGQSRLAPQPFVETQPSPSRLASCSATPARGCGSSDNTSPSSMDCPQSESTILLDDRRPDNILDWYGENRKSLEEPATERLQHDKALVEGYIQSNSKLTAQLASMKTQRRKKQMDSSLVLDYRFIISVYTMLKTMEFEPSPHHVSSKAILTCLGVTPSWLSRAKQVIKLLNKIGPDGSSPDPLVVKRLHSKLITNKGSDLLTFLKQQDRTHNGGTSSP